MMVLPDATYQPLEVFTFGEAQQHGMVGGLGVAFDDLHVTVGID
jgi:hypothetical protein